MISLQDIELVPYYILLLLCYNLWPTLGQRLLFIHLDIPQCFNKCMWNEWMDKLSAVDIYLEPCPEIQITPT